MRDIVIIGGGLSGLAAAWELETLGQPYTLIEVKPRLGGGIGSAVLNGFTLDGGLMLHDAGGDWAFLEALGLSDAVYRVEQRVEGMPYTREWLGFTGGTGALIDALSKRMTPNKHAHLLQRMAVSSLGFRNGADAGDGYAICMENGMVLDTAAVILAAPARYAERMLYTLLPEVALRLLDAPYDRITRVSLGYHQAQIALPLVLPGDMAVAYAMHTAHPARVPEGGVLLQIGVRHNGDPALTLQTVIDELRLPQPLAAQASFWAEADFLSAPGAAPLIAPEELPRGLAVIGSDYLPNARHESIPARVAAGRAAARAVVGVVGR